jgi:hypothetical protein
MTVEMWVNIHEKTGDLLIEKNVTPNVAFRLKYSDFHDEFQYTIGGETLDVLAPALNTWTHIAAVWDDGAKKAILYYNGVNVGSLSDPTYTLADVAGKWSMRQTSTGSFSVDEFRVSDTAKSYLPFHTTSRPVWKSDPIVSEAAQTGVDYIDSLAGAVIDPNGDTITFSKEGGPAWLSVDSITGALSGRPDPVDVGLNSFTIRADDSSAYTDVNLEIEVGRGVAGVVLETTFTTNGTTLTTGVTTFDSNDNYNKWTSKSNVSEDPGAFLKVISGPANSRAVAISIQSGQPGYDDIGAVDTIALTSGDYELRFDLATDKIDAAAPLPAKVGVKVYTVVQDSSGNVNQVTLKLAPGGTPAEPTSPVLVGTAQSTVVASIEWTSDTSGSFALPFHVDSGEDVILHFWALQDAEITSLDNVILYKLLPDMDSYLSWMKAYANTLTALEQVQAADPDFDSYDNLAEYALGMIPDSSDAGTRDFAARAVENGTNYFKYIYHRRTDDDTLTYLAIERTDLIYSSATTNEPDVQSTGAVIDNFEPVTNYYEIDAAPSTFIQLKIQKD